MQGVHLFTFRDIPVRASGWFFLIIALFAFQVSQGGAAAVLGLIAAFALGLLVHEFGHGLVAKRYRLDPEIYLHGFGGLCAHRPIASKKAQALIVAAGPFAGLALAGVLYLLQMAFGSVIGSNLFLAYFFQFSMWINVFWSLFNLLPIYPMDGGQLFRLGMHAIFKKDEVKADRIVYGVGTLLSLGVVVWAIQSQWMMMALIGGLSLFQNGQLFMETNASTPPSQAPSPKAASEGAKVLREAHQTLALGDAHEARRLAYQLRNSKQLTASQGEAAIELIALSSLALHDYEEVLDWSERTAITPELRAARVRALLALGKHRQATEEFELGPLPPSEAKELRLLLQHSVN